MAQNQQKIKAWLFGFPLILIGWFFYLLPLFLKKALGNTLGAVLRFIQFRSEVVKQNMKRAFPEKDLNDPQMKQLYKRFYRHFGMLIFEFFYLFGPMKRFCEKYVHIEGLEHVRELEKQGKSVIFLSSHLGNWEIMCAAVGRNIEQILIVTKVLKPQWLHHMIERGRLRCHVRGTYEPRTMRDILNQLKYKRRVGFVLDQYAGPPIGVRVPFFGVPVGTSNGVATVKRRMNAEVIPAENYRLSNGTWKVILHPPLTWISDENPHRELALNTAHYVSVIEKMIYRTPEQWLWTHRRFKGDLAPLKKGEWEAGRTRKGEDRAAT